MTGLATTTAHTGAGGGRRVVVVVVAVATAVLVNVVLHALGRLAGGEFELMRDGDVARVDALTVAGFSAVPLGVGLTVVALLARVRWVVRSALVLAPALAVLTIALMTVPVDLDAVSTVTLAACHLTLVPVSILAIRRLGG